MDARLIGWMLSGVLCSVTAFASPNDCGAPLDLRKQGRLRYSASGEQGDTYACGFFVAATAIDDFIAALPASTRTKGPRVRSVDPLALAVDLAIERDRSDRWPIHLTTDPLSDASGHRGSYLCDIIQHVRENGVCDHGDPRVGDREFMRRRSNTALELYRILREFSHTSSIVQRLQLDVILPKIRLLLTEEPAGALADAVLAERIWTERETPYRAVRALLYPQCEKKRVALPLDELPRCHMRFYPWGGSHSSGRMHRKIRALLDEPSPSPVPVLQCYQALREGHAYDGSFPFSEDCILHYVSIIGRRSHSGVCQYLVRNSYDPKDAYRVSKDWKRDGEDFWVDAATLEQSAYGVHWLR